LPGRGGVSIVYTPAGVSSKICWIIGRAIDRLHQHHRTAQRTIQLLEESKLQAEELKVREEELKQNLEELQAIHEDRDRKTKEMEIEIKELKKKK
jgi:hypothetical protein